MKLLSCFRSRMLLALTILVASSAAIAAYRSTQARPQTSASLATLLPPGALLTIQSPDFAGLLRDWNASPEQREWLASDNFRVFSNSRLFGRLNDARAEFASAAHAAQPEQINGDFLQQIAGGESIFAWYDVGNLEALYITRLPSARAGEIALLKDHSSWTARQSAGLTFYLRKSSAGSAGEQADGAAEAAQGHARTVAFALVPAAQGDLLVLATREDLIANALALMRPNGSAAANSVASESWFADASAALPQTGSAPALHMVLHLERIVPMPYFRSYWMQQNTTAMSHYRAAVSDLYREPAQFREERALLLQSPEDASSQADLDSLAARVPNDGVFIADALSDPAVAAAALESRLLGRLQLHAAPAENAPDPDLNAPESGSTTDLDTRIDAPAPITPAATNEALTDLLKSASLDAMLTYSAAQLPATPAGLWVPVQSAVLLHATRPWNPAAVQQALQQSLRGALTTGTLGVEFHPEQANGQTLYALSGPKPLFFATQGNLALFADDRALLLAALNPPAFRAQSLASLRMAAFNHSAQRAPFHRLTALIDGTNLQSRDSKAVPQFFSGSIRSLSDSFAPLASEHFLERRDGPLIRQTALYQWQ